MIGTVTVTICSLTACHFLAEREATQNNNPALRNFFEQNFECSLSNFLAGRWWTLFSCSIMHHHPMHALANIMGLLSFAPFTIETLGPRIFVAVWMGAAAISSLSQLAAQELIPDKTAERNGINKHDNSRGSMKGEKRSFGASGCVLAYFAISTYVSPFSKVMLFPIPIGFPLWAVFGAVTGVSGASLWYGWAPGIGHAAHLGGTLFGFLVATRVFLRLRLGR